MKKMQIQTDDVYVMWPPKRDLLSDMVWSFENEVTSGRQQTTLQL